MYFQTLSLAFRNKPIIKKKNLGEMEQDLPLVIQSQNLSGSVNYLVLFLNNSIFFIILYSTFYYI